MGNNGNRCLMVGECAGKQEVAEYGPKSENEGWGQGCIHYE